MIDFSRLSPANEFAVWGICPKVKHEVLIANGYPAEDGTMQPFKTAEQAEKTCRIAEKLGYTEIRIQSL